MCSKGFWVITASFSSTSVGSATGMLTKSQQFMFLYLVFRLQYVICDTVLCNIRESISVSVSSIYQYDMCMTWDQMEGLPLQQSIFLVWVLNGTIVHWPKVVYYIGNMFPFGTNSLYETDWGKRRNFNNEKAKKGITLFSLGGEMLACFGSSA